MAKMIDFDSYKTETRRLAQTVRKLRTGDKWEVSWFSPRLGYVTYDDPTDYKTACARVKELRERAMSGLSI